MKAMSGASIETTLELWASALREVKARMRPLFLQERMARSVGLFLDGLLGPEQVGSLARSVAKPSRATRRRSTTFPALSNPTTLQLFFPRSIPRTDIAVIS